MHLDLSDEEAALIKELRETVETDRYPFSPRIRTLRAILAKLRPEPVREPLPPPKVYAPPRAAPSQKTALIGGANKILTQFALASYSDVPYLFGRVAPNGLTPRHVTGF